MSSSKMGFSNDVVRRMNMNEVIDFLTNGDQSDFSDLSSEGEFHSASNIAESDMTFPLLLSPKELFKVNLLQLVPIKNI